MRLLSTLLVLCCLASSAWAKERVYEVADFTAVSSESSDGGLGIVPLGNSIAAMSIRHTSVYYRLETKDVVYILWRPNPASLNITLHGKTKLSVDGMKAYVLDDAGKVVKMEVVQKIAKKEGQQ